jgi:hypothetical protein
MRHPWELKRVNSFCVASSYGWMRIRDLSNEQSWGKTMDQNNCEPAVDRAWTRKRNLELLHSECSKEFEAICKLPPLKDNKGLIEAYELELGNIVRRHRNRFSKPDHFAHVEQIITSANAAAAGIQKFVEDFNQLADPNQMKLILKVANIIEPAMFPEQSVDMPMSPVFIMWLAAMIRTMDVIKQAIPVATGLSGKKEKGRPPSRYVQAALELIMLWESILFDAAPEPKPPYLAKIVGLVPTAKKKIAWGKEGPEATQVSTEFCRLALRMINPKIKFREVLTAINNARKKRQWLLVKALKSTRRRHPRDPFRHFIRNVAEGKRNIKKTDLFSIPYFLQLY